MVYWIESSQAHFCVSVLLPKDRTLLNTHLFGTMHCYFDETIILIYHHKIFAFDGHLTRTSKIDKLIMRVNLRAGISFYIEELDCF